MGEGENIDMTPRAGLNENREITTAWSQWSSDRASHMKIFHDAGILGPENREWRNIAEHSLVVNATAVFIAEKLKGSGVPVNVDIVDQASLLHDVTKRREREADVSYSTEHGSNLKRSFLVKHDYPESVIAATEYTGRVDDMFIQDPQTQKDAIAARPLEQLIVAYADARVRNTDIVSLETARDLSKQKVPADAAIYDQWYIFYKNVEARLFESVNSAELMPDAITNETVTQMIERIAQTQDTVSPTWNTAV